MPSEESRRLAEALAERVGNDADAAQIAAAMVSTWQDIAAALDPVVGQEGVAAIYRRSILLSAKKHPWLRGVDEDVQTAMNLESLKSTLEQRTASDAVVGVSAFLQTFHDLLAGLIGDSLTGRLLHSVWNKKP